MNKFKLTSEFKIHWGIKLYQIEALKNFGNVSKGDKGGWVEKESNLEQSGNAWVYGNAQVSGNAWVYGNARVSLKASFTKGWFIGGDDSGKITDITDKTGSSYWKNQYVLGDYEITPIEDEKKEVEVDDLPGSEASVTIKGKTYKAIIQ